MLDKDFKLDRKGYKTEKTISDRKNDQKLQKKLMSLTAKPEKLIKPSKSNSKRTKSLSNDKKFIKSDSKNNKAATVTKEPKTVKKMIKSSNKNPLASELFEVTSGSNCSEINKLSDKNDFVELKSNIKAPKSNSRGKKDLKNDKNSDSKTFN